MPEYTRQIRNKIVEYWCDRCHQSAMRSTNVMHVLLSNPPRYEHECPSCGAVANLLKRYPSIEYEYLED